MQKKHQLLLGAHMSITGGFEKALERGESIGCSVIQIFTKSNRQWRAKPLTSESIKTFKNAFKKSPIQLVVAHASYLINIGSDKPEINKKSIEALKIELQRCEMLGIPYLILHPGSCGTLSEKECIEKIAENLNHVLHSVPGDSMILLETMAGQGSNMGYRFEQLKEIYTRIKNKKRVGFCFDTCHTFAAGYGLKTPNEYNALWKEFDTILGLEKLKAIHINDSKRKQGSQVDRHEHIGKGKLGLEPFKLLFNDPRFFDIPKILETPKEKDLKDDIINLKTIRNLLSPETKKILHVK